MPKHLTTMDELLFQSNILKQPNMPQSPIPNQVWMDTSNEPNILYRWDGLKWVPVGFQKDDGTIQIIEDLQNQIGQIIDEIDTKADKESILQKVKEIEDDLASKVNGEFVDGKLIIVNNEIDKKIKDLATKLDEKVNDAVFTQEITDILNSLKDKADLTFVNGQLVSKADKDNTFTKEESINALNSKVSKTEYTTDKEGIVKQLTDQESRITQSEEEIKATVKKVDYQADQKGVVERLTAAESAITQTSTEISSTVKKTDYQLDQKKISESLDGKAGAADLGLLANRVTQNESAITQTAEKIESKVSKITYDKNVADTKTKLDQMGMDLDGKASNSDLNKAVIRITEAESKITQTEQAITSTVKKTEYEKDQQGIATRLSNAESQITQQAGLIESRVTKTEMDTAKQDLNAKIDGNNTATTKRFTEAESRITQTEQAITSTVKKVDFDATTEGLVTRLNNVDSKIVQTEKDITSKVSQTKYDLDQTSMNSRMQNAESKITQQAGLIESKVTKTDYDKDKDGMITRLSDAESKITQQAGLIESRVTKTEFGAATKTLDDKIEAVKIQAGDGEAIEQRFVQAESRITQTEQAITASVKKTDYDKDQQGITNRFVNAESRLTQTEKDITARVTNTTFDNSMKGKLDVTTFNNKVAEIKATTDQISSTVGSVKTSFEGMKVGGRNLLMDTKDKTLKGTNPSATNHPGIGFPFVAKMYPIVQGGPLTISFKASSSGFKKGTTNSWVGIELRITYSDSKQAWLPLRIEDKLPNTSDFTMYSTVVNLENKPITEIVGNSLIRDVQGTVEIKEWQVEIGNVATDYKPANEEIDANLNGKANNSDLDAVKVRVTNTESRITQTESAISLRATKEEVTNQINNISVGSRNLIQQSEFIDTSKWIFGSGYKTGTGIMPNGIIHFQGEVKGDGYADLTFYVENIEPNTEYTFSCNAGGSFQTYLWEKKADKTPTAVYKDNVKSHYEGSAFDMSWPRSKFTRTIRTQPDTRIIQFIFRVQDISSGKTGTSGRLALPKLEKGNVATDWSPAPEDTNSRFNNIRTGGRNLLKGSDILKTPWGTDQPANVTSSAKADSKGKYMEFKITKDEPKIVNSYVWLNEFWTRKPSKNQEYTMSATATSTLDNASLNIRDDVANTYYGTQIPKSTTETRIYFTVKYYLDFNKFLLVLNFPTTAKLGDIVTLRDFQLEDGNVPSDYTISPEEIDAAINDKVSNAEYTKKMAELKVTTDGITSSVTSTNQRIDGISIGAANLMDNTSNFTDTRSWAINGGTSLRAITQQDGIIVLEAIGSIQHKQLVPVKASTEYVLTVEIMFTKDTTLANMNPIHWWLTDGTGTGNQSGIESYKRLTNISSFKANTWTTVSILFKTKSTVQPGAYFKFFVYGADQLTADNKYWLKTVKFEEGNIPSAYSPSAADSSYGELYVRGVGNDRPGNRSVVLNGKEIAMITFRGHNLICIKRSDLSIVSNEIFDTHSNTQTPALVTKLNGLNDDVIVVLTTYDSGYVNNQLAAALKRFGGTGREANKMRVPHAFIGIAGIGEGAGIESMTDSGATTPPAEISTKIINGIPQGINIGASEALSRVASAESRITQTEKDITSKVSNTDYNGTKLVSMINQTASTVMIDAKNINLNGFLTIGHFSSDVQNRIQTGVDAKGVADSAKSSADTANSTINNNKGTWDRASNINSNGTFNTAKLNGTLSDSQIASAANWNGAKSLMDSWKSGTTMINGGMIATNTIFAQQINIGDYTNLSQVDESKNPNGIPTAVINGKKYFKVGTGAYANLIFADSTIADFKLNDEYYIAFNGYRDAGVTNLNAIIRYYYSDGTYENAGMIAMTPGTSDSRIANNLKITKEPNDAKTLTVVRFFFEKDGGTSGYYYVRNLEVRKRYGGDLIIDGSLTFDKARGGSLILGGSGNQNGTLFIKDASGNNIVTGNQNGINITGGKLTVARPDGANFIQDGIMQNDFAVTSHQPPFRGGNITTRSWYWATDKGQGFGRDDQVCDFFSFKHSSRYVTFEMDYLMQYGGGAGALLFVQAGKFDANGKEVVLRYIDFNNTTPVNAGITIDLGKPTYQKIGIYVTLYSWSGPWALARCIRAYLEG